MEGQFNPVEISPYSNNGLFSHVEQRKDFKEVIEEFRASRPPFWSSMTPREKWNYVAVEQKVRAKNKKKQLDTARKSYAPKHRKSDCGRIPSQKKPRGPRNRAVYGVSGYIPLEAGFVRISDLIKEFGVTRTTVERSYREGNVEIRKTGPFIAISREGFIEHRKLCKEHQAENGRKVAASRKGVKR